LSSRFYVKANPSLPPWPGSANEQWPSLSRIVAIPQTGLVESSSGELAAGAPLRAVADQLDDALLCFDLLQEELGLPAGAGPRYRRLLGGSHGVGQIPR
jgi:hypothetical protein